MWANETVFYQFYPLGMTGAPYENDGVLTHRIRQIETFIPHLTKCNVGAVYFSPIFESDTHGYNTRDYKKIDTRLGTHEDFKELVKKFHDAGIRVIVDGVFNHVGRGFFAFRDVQEKRWDSQYKDWFHISFDGNSNYNDGFWYEGWEGNFDLVKLNLQNEAVVQHIFEAVDFWKSEFDIDGLRLDVAYCLDRGFLHRLREHCNGISEDFFLVGEMVHGNYYEYINDGMLHSVTNYECYKGLFSSMNSYNLFEIVHSLLRLFGPEDWCLCRGMHLLAFVDNHDVSRIASNLENPKHLPLIYGMLFAMPGIPIIYYGSEWGITGKKSDGDPALRPEVKEPQWNELTDLIAKLADIKRHSEALNYGGIRQVVLTNRQCIIERKSENERIMIAINIDENEYTAHFDAGCGQAEELITGTTHDFGGGSVLPGYSVQFWKMER